MFINISILRKGLAGTFSLIILILLANYLIINLPFQNNFINAISPLFFLIFLLSPYLNKQSNIIGGFFGYLIYSMIIIKIPIMLSILFSIAVALILLFHNSLFKEEPEAKKHIILNVFVCLLSSASYAWLLSITNSINLYISFTIAFQAYFYFGLISTIVIVPVFTYLYGVKLNSSTSSLRR